MTAMRNDPDPKKTQAQALRRASGHLSTPAVIFLTILPIVTGFACICIGRMQISPSDVCKAILSQLGMGCSVPKTIHSAVIGIRIPRVLLALLCGAGLSVSGCVFQSLFANPLATPDTLGVASGASFGAALGILLGFDLVGIQGCSLLFGCAAVFLTWVSAPEKGKGMSSVVLSGIMIGSLFSALVSLIKFVADEESQLPAITYWLMGSLSSAGYASLKLGAPPILISIAVAFVLRWRLNILPLSDEEARSSGVHLTALRGVTVVCATLITASCVSMCGQVGWVGLLVPHICRMKFGSNHLALVPASISLGATFVAVVDTIARSATASEIPISILTAIIGAPFFIMLMRRTGGWKF